MGNERRKIAVNEIPALNTYMPSKATRVDEGFLKIIFVSLFVSKGLYFSRLSQSHIFL